MIPQSLISYIREQLNKGYTENQLRDYLLKYGYSKDQVDQAFSMLREPIKVHHEIHLSKTTIAVILLVLFVASGISYFVFFKGEEKTLLDIELEEIKTSVKPGEEIQFIVKISNLGAEKRYDVKLTYSVITEAGKRITFKQETKAIETSATSQVKILIPKNTDVGNYKIEAVARYNGKTAEASLPMEILEVESKEPTCIDGIKNGDEEGIDCGGKCKACEKCPASCDDSNRCTRDYCNEETNFQCRYDVIENCCGNLECEPEENWETCSADCSKPGEDPLEGISNWEKLDKIEEIAKTNSDKAEELCSQFDQQIFIDQCYLRIVNNADKIELCSKIQDERTKNECYQKIALTKNMPSICESITKVSVKDTCYINFVIQKKDYSICNKIFNEYLRQSCESLREMSSLQGTGGAIAISNEELMKMFGKYVNQS